MSYKIVMQWGTTFRISSLLILLAGVNTRLFGQDSDAGRIVYNDHGCFSCHGYQGKGTHVERANHLFPKPPILLKGQSPFLVSEEVFRTYLRLREEQHPEQPSVRMPNYPSSTLDDAAVADLYAHIMEFPLDEPALEDITTMKWILQHAESQ